MNGVESHAEPSGQHVVIWVNPRAGRGRARSRVAAIARALSEAGWDVLCSSDRQEVLAAVRTWHAQRELRAVVVAGGDGTLNDVVSRTPPGTPLLPVPFGTENLMARYLGVRRSARAVATIVGEGVPVILDAARFRATEDAGIAPEEEADVPERLFMVVGSAGFDAAVVHALHAGRIGPIRRWTYAGHIVRTIRAYTYPALRITMEGVAGRDKPIDQVARWAFVFNLPRYALGLGISRSADPADGLLDVCLFRRGGLGQGLRYTAQVALRRHERLADFTCHRCRRVRIEGASASAGSPPAAFQADGDPFGHVPVEIEVAPGRVCFLVDRRRLRSDDLAGGLARGEA